MSEFITRKYLIDKEAVCSECLPEKEWWGSGVDAEAKKHALETGHIVTIHETHDVARFIKPDTEE